MVDLNEDHLKRITFHLITFKNQKARRTFKNKNIDIISFFELPHQEMVNLGFTAREATMLKNEPGKIANMELKKVQDKEVSIIFIDDEEYPLLLKEIYDPPDFIYFIGNKAVLKKQKIAVVGSRRGTRYGHLALSRVLPDLCRAGLTIVSGMAYGIDSMAHKITIREKGNTIGINAGGLIHFYPSGNMPLINKIIENGGIITEFPMDAIPRPFLFPVRNRIISGLSKGVLIAEATLKSGSLITAKLALDQNRDIFAVPGNIDAPLSKGPNYLIQQGAKPVTASTDILTEYGLRINHKREAFPHLSLKEKKILALMEENELKGIDYFVERLDFSTAEIIAIIMGLVLKNLIIEEAGLYKRIDYG